MKTIRNYLVILLMFLMCYLAKGQERLTLSLYQDLKLATIGDERGNKAFTTNLVGRINMQGNQQKYGYMQMFYEHEIASLKPVRYARYSLNIGYNFNRLILDDFEIGVSGGYGWINRENSTYNSFGASGIVNYKISDKFKVSAQYQVIDRREWKAIRSSFMVGIEFFVY